MVPEVGQRKGRSGIVPTPHHRAVRHDRHIRCTRRTSLEESIHVVSQTVGEEVSETYEESYQEWVRGPLEEQH